MPLWLGLAGERSNASTRPVRAEGLDRACAPRKEWSAGRRPQREKSKRRKRGRPPRRIDARPHEGATAWIPMWRRRSRRRSHGGRPYRIEGWPESGARRIPVLVSPYHAVALYGHPGARSVSDAAMVGDGRERSDASTRTSRAEGLDRACAPRKNERSGGRRPQQDRRKRKRGGHRAGSMPGHTREPQRGYR